MIDLKLLDPIFLAITVSSNFPKKPIYKLHTFTYLRLQNFDLVSKIEKLKCKK